jgi:hypothetical protein
MEVIEGGKEGIEVSLYPFIRVCLTRQRLKDEYHANKGKLQKASGGAKSTVRQDGILESDSEDERIVRENKQKRKAATAEDGEKEVKDEVVVKKDKEDEKDRKPVKKRISKA